MVDFVTSLCNNGHGREIEEFEFRKEFHASLCLCVVLRDLRVRVLYRPLYDDRRTDVPLGRMKHLFTIALLEGS
jgi:hypothetical protein